MTLDEIKKLLEEMYEMVVQVNGKVRGKVNVSQDTPKEEIEKPREKYYPQDFYYNYDPSSPSNSEIDCQNKICYCKNYYNIENIAINKIINPIK